MYVLWRLPSQRRGEFDHPEIAEVETHLLTCNRCQSRAKFLGDVTAALRAVLGSPEFAPCVMKAGG